MAASTTVTEPLLGGYLVKQHGFVVRDATPLPLTVSLALQPTDSSESNLADGNIRSTLSTSSSGLTRATLGLKSDQQTAANPTLSPHPTPTPNPTPATLLDSFTITSDITRELTEFQEDSVEEGDTESEGMPSAGDVRPTDYAHLTPGVKRLMRSVVRGLKAHQEPEAATEGLGGTYFFRNEYGTKIAIMKPCDEEPLAPNNPKGFVGRCLGDPGLKPTIRVGEAAAREVAAYLLDHDHFSRVPHTVMVRMSHPIFHLADRSSTLPLKLGSLQEFVSHEGDASEVGASRFPVRDVQRIGILDLRLFNTDRHAGNILVRQNRASSSQSGQITMNASNNNELIPIDHGFAMPEALEPPYFEWQHWPQAMLPFGPEELEYISKLDPRADVELLRRELPHGSLREESFRVLEVSTTLLKKCAAAGMTLSEIAGVMTRPLIGIDDEPSGLEKVCNTARLLALEMRPEDDDDVQQVLLLECEEEGEDFEAEAEEHLEEKNATTIANNTNNKKEEEEEEEEATITTITTTTRRDGGASEQAAKGKSRQAEKEEEEEDEEDTYSDSGSRDALFGMDDATCNSPVHAQQGAPSALKVVPALMVAHSGEVVTPGAVVGMSFSIASTDDVSPSQESSLNSRFFPQEFDRNFEGSSQSDNSGSGMFNDEGMSMTGESPNVVSTKRLASSFVPRRHPMKPSLGNNKIKTGGRTVVKVGRSRVSEGSRGQGVFSGLNDQQWEEFMRVFNDLVDEALSDQTWQDLVSNVPTAGPVASCPHF